MIKNKNPTQFRAGLCEVLLLKLEIPILEKVHYCNNANTG
jgi:hypothetical protein